MEASTCLFLGGAEHPRYHELHRQLQQRRILQSVQHDFQQMVTFAEQHSELVQTPNGIVPTKMTIGKVLINADIYEDFIQDAAGTFPVGQPKRQLIDQADWISYDSKAEVRGAVQDFLARSPTPHLILFMSGHGEQQEKRCKNQPVQDMFLLPERGGKVLDYYTDKDLTDDIRSCLPAHKRLYIVCHACHSGGLVNLWELDARDKWVVLFASLEASILQEWNSSEVEPGFYQSFCKHSKRGQKLQDIAEGILNDTTRHHAGNIVRPAFITSRPVLALEKFLVTQ